MGRGALRRGVDGEERREAGRTDSQAEFTGGEDPLLLISKDGSCSG